MSKQGLSSIQYTLLRIGVSLTRVFTLVLYESVGILLIVLSVRGESWTILTRMTRCSIQDRLAELLNYLIHSQQRVWSVNTRAPLLILLDYYTLPVPGQSDTKKRGVTFQFKPFQMVYQDCILKYYIQKSFGPIFESLSLMMNSFQYKMNRKL